MSDIHVLTDNGRGKVSVVLHILTPVGTNVPGVPWAVALVNSGLGGTTRMKDGDGTNGTISTAEKTAIEAGTLYETSISYALEDGSGTDTAAQRAALRALSVREKAAATKDIQRRLKYFGHTESEA